MEGGRVARLRAVVLLDDDRAEEEREREAIFACVIVLLAGRLGCGDEDDDCEEGSGDVGPESGVGGRAD